MKEQNIDALLMFRHNEKKEWINNFDFVYTNSYVLVNRL